MEELKLDQSLDIGDQIKIVPTLSNVIQLQHVWDLFKMIIFLKEHAFKPIRGYYAHSVRRIMLGIKISNVQRVLKNGKIF